MKEENYQTLQEQIDKNSISIASNRLTLENQINLVNSDLKNDLEIEKQRVSYLEGQIYNLENEISDLRGQIEVLLELLQRSEA